MTDVRLRLRVCVAAALLGGLAIVATGCAHGSAIQTAGEPRADAVETAAGKSAAPVRMREDQSLVGQVNLGGNINEGFRYVGQTYVAGRSGSLVAISLDVRSKRRMNPEGGFAEFPLRVSIYAFDNPQEAEELLTFDLPTDDATLDTVVILPKPVPQVKDHTYAIVVHYPTAPEPGGGKYVGVWYGMSGKEYLNGSLIMSKDAETWRVDDDGDLRFRTYLAVEVAH